MTSEQAELAPRRYSVGSPIDDRVRRQLSDTVWQSGETPVVVLESRAVQRFQMETLVEGHHFVSDEPIPAGGGDLGPAPLRYFVAGIVQCVQIWCIKVAALDRVSIAELKIDARAYLEKGTIGEGALSASASLGSGRGFRVLELDIWLSTDDDTSADVALQTVRKGIRACPAAVAFGRGSALEFVLHYNGEQVGR